MQRNMPKFFWLLFVSLISFPLSTLSCTTIFWNTKNHPLVVARSTDLFVSDTPLIKVLPRGAKHTGEAGKNSYSWVSKYGSLVVTAFNTDTVSDGLNEKGLAAHLLYLADTVYPQSKEGEWVISNLLWGQYILDNFATVDEALKNITHLRLIATEVHGKKWPLHLTMEDSSGDSAVVEFIKGKMVVYHGPQYQIMTNEPAYNIQLANLKKYQGFGGKLPLPGDPDPLSRFVRAATFLKTLPQPNDDLQTIAYTLSAMRSAMVPFGAVDTSGNKVEDAWATRWVSVADITNKIYYFNSTMTPNIIWIDLNKLNFAQGAAITTLDPNGVSLEADVSDKLI